MLVIYIMVAVSMTDGALEVCHHTHTRLAADLNSEISSHKETEVTMNTYFRIRINH